MEVEREAIPFPEDVLQGFPSVFKFVWALKQSAPTNEIKVSMPVSVDHGFVNCKDGEERQDLMEADRQALKKYDTNHLCCTKLRLGGRSTSSWRAGILQHPSEPGTPWVNIGHTTQTACLFCFDSYG